MVAVAMAVVVAEATAMAVAIDITESDYSSTSCHINSWKASGGRNDQ
jgi:hypothetical protein